MSIIREPDGTLLVPTPVRSPDADETEGSADKASHDKRDSDAAAARHDDGGKMEEPAPPVEPHALHPGEGGYDEALAEWDHQQDPDRPPAVSTPSGRQQAMAVIHTVATTPKRVVGDAVDSLNDREGCAAALRHVLAGGVPSVTDFATEVAEATDSAPLPAHEVTQIIGDVLAALDA